MNAVREKSDNRLTVDTAALLMVDHQTGLFSLVGDHTPGELRSGVLALASTARLFKLPVVLSTSVEKGPNGPLMPELRKMFPKAPLIMRKGEINAWDSEEFVKAVKKTGRKQLIVAGLVTDVCVAEAALSAARAGYQVFAAMDASGTTSWGVRETTVARLAMGGVTPINWFAIASQLMRDWRNDEQGLMAILAEYMPAYRNLITSHQSKS